MCVLYGWEGGRRIFTQLISVAFTSSGNPTHFISQVEFLSFTDKSSLYGNGRSGGGTNNTVEKLHSGTATTHSNHALNVTLYVVFGVAITVFVIIAIIVCKMVKKKSANGGGGNGYTLTSTGKRRYYVLINV